MRVKKKEKKEREENARRTRGEAEDDDDGGGEEGGRKKRIFARLLRRTRHHIKPCIRIYNIGGRSCHVCVHFLGAQHRGVAFALGIAMEAVHPVSLVHWALAYRPTNK